MSQTNLHPAQPEIVANTSGNHGQNSLPDVSTIRLQIGDVCCAFKFRDDDIYNRLREFYNIFLTDNQPDIIMELEGYEQLSPGNLGKAISKTKYTHNTKNDFQTTSKIMSGEYDLINRYIKITGEKRLADPTSKLNHLNRMISLAYYMACKIKYVDTYPAMMVHGCGILRNGQVLIFTGPSGAGKSTLAGLCGEQDGEVINDEIMLVSRPDTVSKEMVVRSVPILGAFPCRRRVTAPLHSISLLKQGNKTSVRPLEKTEAYLRLMRQIITPTCIGHGRKREILSLIADFSMEIISSIPVFELEFNLDKDALWQAVGEVEEMVKKGEHQ